MPRTPAQRANVSVLTNFILKKENEKIQNAWSGIRTHASRRDSNLSRAPWTARPSKPEAAEKCLPTWQNTPDTKISKWSIGVSIPVPRACKARTLPIELMPLFTSSGTRTHNLTLRRGAPYPLGHGGTQNYGRGQHTAPD